MFFNIKKSMGRMANRAQKSSKSKEHEALPLTKLLGDEFGLEVVEVNRAVIDMMGLSCDLDVKDGKQFQRDLLGDRAKSSTLSIVEECSI